MTQKYKKTHDTYLLRLLLSLKGYSLKLFLLIFLLFLVKLLLLILKSSNNLNAFK